MFEWVTDNARLFMSRGYLDEGVSVEERVRIIADAAEKILGLKGFSDKFYNYMGKGYYSLATPIRTNFGNDKGLGISCYSIEYPDNIPGIMNTLGELGVMSKLGGGVGSYLGNIRPRGSDIKGGKNGKTGGAVHFAELIDKASGIISQGGSRRGFTSPFLPVEHGDIEEFLDIGTEGHPIQRCTTGVTITDNWMNEMIGGDEDKRNIWRKILKQRSEVGYPYISFIDTINNNAPECYKKNGLKVKTQNICQEITGSTDENHSFVCCLSSLNIERYDERKDTDAVETLVYFLDAVMSEFILKLEKYRDSENKEDNETFRFMKKAYNFAVRERMIGVGGLGWHYYLQSKMIPIESERAFKENEEIWLNIKNKTNSASEKMANEFGEPTLLKGLGRRHSHLRAIAPTKSSSYILNTSEGIEPLLSNYFGVTKAKVSDTVKNRYLEKLLEEKGCNHEEVRDEIRENDGSVALIPFLSDEEKDVFKTMREIDQNVLVEQAADRAKHIDQSQSLNLSITPEMSAKDISDIYIKAWNLGVKSIYYALCYNASQEAIRKMSGCKGGSCES